MAEFGTVVLDFAPMIVAFAIWFMAEMSKDHNYYSMSAGMMLYAGVVCPLPEYIRVIPVGLGFYMVVHFYFYRKEVNAKKREKTRMEKENAEI